MAEKQKKNWKKIIAWTAGVLIVVLLIVRLMLPGIIKTSVNNIGPMLIGGPVSIQDVSLSILGGRVQITGLAVGNADGFSAPNALTAEKIVVDIAPFSLLSKKIHVEEFTFSGVDLYCEQRLTQNNLSELNSRIQNKAAGKKAEADNPDAVKEQKKLQVDDINLTNIRLHVGLASASAPVPMPGIELENLGTGPDGITGMEVVAKIFDKLTLGAVSAAGGVLKDTGSALFDKGKETGDAIIDQGSKAKDDAINASKNLINKIF